MPDAEQVKLVWVPGKVRIIGSEIPEELARKEDIFEFVFFFVLITWFSVNGLDWFKPNIPTLSAQSCRQNNNTDLKGSRNSKPRFLTLFKVS